MSKETSSEILQQLSTDIFLVKEKLDDGEYMLLLNKTKKLYEKIKNDKETTLKLYNRYDKLRDKYIKISSCFTNLYSDTHEPDDDDDTLISFVST